MKFTRLYIIFVHNIDNVQSLQFSMILFHVNESNANSMHYFLKKTNKFNALLFQNQVMVMLIQCSILVINANSMHYFSK